MKHTDNYYINRIKKILGDNFYFHSWCTPTDRGVYLTLKNSTTGERLYQERTYESLYNLLKENSKLF